MITMALNTVGADCSVAIIARDKAVRPVLAYRSKHIGVGHAEHLAPMVTACFAEAGLAPRHINRLALVNGPGSFTGLLTAINRSAPASKYRVK